MRAATVEIDEVTNLITIYRVEGDELNLWVRVPGADIASVKLNSKIGRALLVLDGCLRDRKSA